MRYTLHPEALQELDAAIAYYEGCEPGLGQAFLAEVEAAFQRMVDFPDAWPVYSRRARRCLTNRFPFGVIYYRHGQAFLVIAVAHLARRPGYWHGRLG